ncbi:MAG TPA: glycosyltransferase family 2 protein [Gammaproteobacteria bacterium]|nr:glycosyltransferase family 2 protein [Gammaproteobacteria bacterium]
MGSRVDQPSVSIIIPAYNEAAALEDLLPKVRALMADAEIIVVDDCSDDPPIDLCQRHNIRLIRHPRNLGNGAAVKTGARRARGEVLVFMDGDGQHDPEDIPRLLVKLEQGFDMVVGARSRASQANIGRGLANRIYNKLASLIVGHPIPDLTSGFRAARAALFKDFIYLLPNGFSYPTTSTMAFFRSGYPVGYLPITAAKRNGKSHIRPIRDGARFLLIIFKVGTLYSPLKVFAPAGLFFFLIGWGYYLYTFMAMHRFTNMSALLIVTGILIFLMGLISEQVTALTYNAEKRQ